MTAKKQRVIGTSRGTPRTEDDIQRLADQAEAGYNPSPLRPRGGRPRIDSAPAAVVPVRLDPELRAAAEARATADQTSISEIIREALRRFRPEQAGRADGRRPRPERQTGDNRMHRR